MKKTWTIKQKARDLKNGRLYWKTLRVLDNPRDADEWLTAWIRVNHFDGTEFTIVYNEK